MTEPTVQLSSISKANNKKQDGSAIRVMSVKTNKIVKYVY